MSGLPTGSLATASSVNDGDRVKEVIVDSRITKVIALRTDSITMLESLDAISEFYGSNTADARRALRQNLEFQNIDFAKSFLQQMEQIKQNMDHVETLSNSLQDSCKMLASKVVEADENMKTFIDKANSLEVKKTNLLHQKVEIVSFLQRYHMTQEEIEVLHHGDLNTFTIAQEFFTTLTRLKRAYQDCKNMTEKQFYNVGFELLDVLGQHQDMAYLHLFTWVKDKCEILAEALPGASGGNSNTSTAAAGNMTSEQLDRLNYQLQVAIRYLQDMPMYFLQCQDLLINARRTQLVHRFMLALTQGDSSSSLHGNHHHSGIRNRRGNASSSSSSSSGNNKNNNNGNNNNALDLLSHDAIAYVGAMLAWMHQAIAAEQEFFEGIFQPTDSNGNTSPAGNSNTSGGNGVLSLAEVLARTIQGVGRPLRVRIQQTLENNPSLEVLFALADLLAFYEHTFAKIIVHAGSNDVMENAIHSTIKGCLAENKRLFVHHLRKQAESLKTSPIASPMDLKVSMVAKECAMQITGILRVCSNALSSLPTTMWEIASSSSSSGEQNPNPMYMDNVIGDIVQPLFQSCRLGGQALQAVEMAVYMLNNVSFLQHEISESFSLHSGGSNSGKFSKSSSPHSTSSSAWQELLEQEASTWITVLVTEEVQRALRRSDIDKVVELIEVLPSGLKASEQMGLYKDRIDTVTRAFYASLFSTVSPQYERLYDPKLREKIRMQVVNKISDAHAKVHQLVSNEFHGYDSSILTHSIEEVNVLLGSTTEGDGNTDRMMQ